MEERWDTIVVGAGISGLLAARELKANGLRVLVVDKGRGVGGRLSRRRTPVGVYDHGAQYFTASEARFVALVEEWLEQGLVREWAQGFALQDGSLKVNGVQRFIGVGGMNAFSKMLASDLDVLTSAKVAQVRFVEEGWTIDFEQLESKRCSSVIMTSPVPQSLDLLSDSLSILDTSLLDTLTKIEYERCLALLVHIRGQSLIPHPGGIWLSGEPIAWMADNTQKGISGSDEALITIHAGPIYSRDHWEAEGTQVEGELLREAAPWLGGEVVTSQLHRWKFSFPVHVHPERCLAATRPAPLVFAGDAFGGPKVEGAALSGLSAAETLLKALKR